MTASIGKYCGVGVFSSGAPFPWSKQRRFIDQCDELSCNSTWWGVLSSHRVSFDPSVFSQPKDSQSTVNQNLQGYCDKMVWNAAKKLGPRSTITLARRFTKDYGLNKHTPPSILIEFLLSVPGDEANGSCAEAESKKTRRSDKAFDIRNDLDKTEAAIRECLALLPTLNQNSVVRKCVVSLEADHRISKDYDRLAMVFKLYRECLNKLSGLMKKSDTRAKAHEDETGRIERRQDALVILSSIFERYEPERRPEFTKLFEPLPRDPSQSSTNARKGKINVVGADAAGVVFDPLAPLESVLDDCLSPSNSIVAALAPLCSLLLLPSGYMHARSLVLRFKKLKVSGMELPSFDVSVVPIAKRLKTSRDRADLAWWCSLQYDHGSVDQLKCLDMAHANATEASEEAESCKDAEEEYIALERVKCIDAARSGLSDKILVTEVLKRHETNMTKVCAFFKSIVDKAHERTQSDHKYCPENLVRALLIEGSLTAAAATLDDTDGFTTHHFRSLALMVHDACKCLSNRYSHVNIGKFARLMTRQWLVHGDDGNENLFANLKDSKGDETEHNKEGESRTDMKTGDESESTSEFVMDIGSITSVNQTWSSSDSNNVDRNEKVTSTEEASALSLSSQRELSDHFCSRVALRISFLICFAENYHHHTVCSPEEENENIHINVLPKKPKKLSAKRQRAEKSCRKESFFEGDLALQHARELLGIVFARQGSTIASTLGFLFDESSAFDESVVHSVSENGAMEAVHAKRTALSFAMRHRALRVATFLCPQEVIARVVVEETYFSDFGDAHMSKCAFGSFVAMEIEAMGLPLPHSNLLQLSTMHFSSYARTIWRNHVACSSSREFSGRLHLLLLELCVNEQDTIDWELIILLFSELERLELPRSLLLACECAVKSRSIALAASQQQRKLLQCVESAVGKIAELIVREVETNISVGIQLDASECSSTLHRLTSIINTEGLYADPICFVEMFSNLSNRCAGQGQKAASDVFVKAAIRIAQHLTDPEVFGKASAIVPLIIKERNENDNASHNHLSRNHICNEEIHKFESLFC